MERGEAMARGLCVDGPDPEWLENSRKGESPTLKNKRDRFPVSDRDVVQMQKWWVLGGGKKGGAAGERKDLVQRATSG